MPNLVTATTEYTSFDVCDKHHVTETNMPNLVTATTEYTSFDMCYRIAKFSDHEIILTIFCLNLL